MDKGLRHNSQSVSQSTALSSALWTEEIPLAEISNEDAFVLQLVLPHLLMGPCSWHVWHYE